MEWKRTQTSPQFHTEIIMHVFGQASCLFWYIRSICVTLSGFDPFFSCFYKFFCKCFFLSEFFRLYVYVCAGIICWILHVWIFISLDYFTHIGWFERMFEEKFSNVLQFRGFDDCTIVGKWKIAKISSKCQNWLQRSTKCKSAWSNWFLKKIEAVDVGNNFSMLFSDLS